MRLAIGSIIRTFTDLYETIDAGSYPASPSPIYFNARPVAGGHYSLLSLLRRDQIGGGANPMAPVSS